MTLAEHFFEDNADHEKELSEMATKLQTMGNNTGCRIQYFKENEGVPGDGRKTSSDAIRERCRR